MFQICKMRWYHGLHAAGLDGVPGTETFDRAKCDFDGVDIAVAVDNAREDSESSDVSRSALRRNWSGVKGAPTDGVDGKA